MRHKIVNDEAQLQFRFEVLGKKGFIEFPVPLRVLFNADALQKFIDDMIDKFIVQDAMDNAPEDLQ